jgi:hypothetical protein
MAVDIRLIGRMWKVTDKTLDGFKVISVELELASWKDNEELWTYMKNVIFDGFPLPGSRLCETDFDVIIHTLKEYPSKIYTYHSNVKADIATFTKIKDWFKKNYPHGWVEFDVGN